MSSSFRFSRIVISLCWAGFATGCGSNDDNNSNPDEVRDGGATTPSEDGAPPTVGGGQSWDIEWGPVVAASGEENTLCVVKRLGNEGQVRIGTIENDLGPASHHMIVYRTNDTEERPEPFECDPFLDTLNPSMGAPLTVSQKARETITLPPGVAITFDPGQMIRLELHYINTTVEPIEMLARSTFTSIAPDAFEHEADFLFIGDTDIEIPPRSTRTEGPTYFPLPPELADAQFFGITGHTHQWGTEMQVATTTGAAGTDTPVYAPVPFSWDEPETIYHDPPFVVPDNGGFRFHCTWQNLSDETVGFGESANDEMCFFWAYYFPSQGSKVCFQSDAFSVEACCPGNALCSLLLGS